MKGEGEVDTALKKMRKAKGFTQVKVAQKSGITEVSYQRYEAEERLPNIRTAIRIADALGVLDLRQLWGGNPAIEKEPDDK